MILGKVHDLPVFRDKPLEMSPHLPDKILFFFLSEKPDTLIFAVPKREFSSAGSEHLPYKQRVGGSNPSTPTEKEVSEMEPFFISQLTGSTLPA